MNNAAQVIQEPMDFRATARLLWKLIVTPIDELAGFAASSGGQNAEVSVRRLCEAREVLAAVASTVQSGGENHWRAVRKARDLLCYGVRPARPAAPRPCVARPETPSSPWATAPSTPPPAVSYSNDSLPDLASQLEPESRAPVSESQVIAVEPSRPTPTPPPLAHFTPLSSAPPPPVPPTITSPSEQRSASARPSPWAGNGSCPGAIAPSSRPTPVGSLQTPEPAPVDQGYAEPASSHGQSNAPSRNCQRPPPVRPAPVTQTNNVAALPTRQPPATRPAAGFHSRLPQDPLAKTVLLDW